MPFALFFSELDVDDNMNKRFEKPKENNPMEEGLWNIIHFQWVTDFDDKFKLYEQNDLISQTKTIQ